VYLTLADTFINPLALFTTTLFIGLLIRFLGPLGSLLIVPALNIFGVPVSYAVGTTIAYLLGRAVIETVRWESFPNAVFRQGILLGLQTAAGIGLGKVLLLTMAELNITGPPVRWFYITLLLGSGFAYALHRKLPSLPTSLRLPGLLPFIALSTGILTGLTGLNPLLLLLPGMLLLGTTATEAATTATLALLVATTWGTFTLSFGGRVEPAVLILLLIGTTAGELLGAFAQSRIRDWPGAGFAGKCLILAGVSLLLKQLGLTTPGGYLLWGMSLLLVLYISIRAAVGTRHPVPSRPAATKKALP